jgi:hypothetical protein
MEGLTLSCCCIDMVWKVIIIITFEFIDSVTHTYMTFIGEGSFGLHQLTFIAISGRLIVFHLERVGGLAGWLAFISGMLRTSWVTSKR